MKEGILGIDMNKKILLLFTVLALAVSLVACGKSATEVNLKSDKAQVQENDFDTTLKNVKDSGYLKIGVYENEPFSFTDENGNWTGYDVELAKEVASQLGVEAKFVKITTNGISELTNGNFDVMWSGCKVEPETEDKVTFSIPYLTTSHIIVVRANSEDTFKEKLDGKKIGVLVNCDAAGVIAQDEMFSKLEKRDILTFYDTPTALAYLRNKQMEALILDEFLYSYYVKDPTEYMVLEDKLGSEEYAVAAGIGAKKLIHEIDTNLTLLKENGKTKEIYEKWFKEKK